jgi:microcompartment protein CcmK/EutM
VGIIKEFKWLGNQIASPQQWHKMEDKPIVLAKVGIIKEFKWLGNQRATPQQWHKMEDKPIVLAKVGIIKEMQEIWSKPSLHDIARMA